MKEVLYVKQTNKTNTPNPTSSQKKDVKVDPIMVKTRLLMYCFGNSRYTNL